MIEIRITGPRGSGKTTTAIAIGLLLKELGQNVTLVGATLENTHHLVEMVRTPTPFQSMPERFSNQQDFTIVDDCIDES